MQIVRFLHTTYPKSANGASLYQILWFVAKELERESIQARSAAISYQAILSSFPACIVLISMVSHIPNNQFRELVIDYFLYLIPELTQSFVDKLIYEIKEAIDKSQSYGIALYLGVLLSFYFASSGVKALMVAFDKAANPDYKPLPFFKKQFTALGVTLLLMIVFLITITFVLSGQYILHRIFELWGSGKIIEKIALKGLWAVLTIGLVFNSVAIIYRYVAPFKKHWQYSSAGAWVATFFCLGASWVFSFYLKNVGFANAIYGSVWLLVSIMIWIRLIATGILIGFELNVSIHNNFIINNLKDNVILESPKNSSFKNEKKIALKKNKNETTK